MKMKALAAISILLTVVTLGYASAEKAVDRPPGARVRRYRLTSEGLEHLQATDAELSPLADYVSQATHWVTSLSFPELVSAIYARYPAYKKNSVFVE